ncbi:MAG: hypothetical protein ACTSVY_03020 [Candidatus Helarchaeota archaeon]
MADNLFFALIFGMTQAILLNIGKGFQKNAFVKTEELNKKQKRINQLLWLIGTILIVVSTLVLMQAEIFGYLSIIASMTGVGIISVTLYSSFVLKERIGKNELIGILLIITGTFLVPIILVPNVENGMNYYGIIIFSIFLISFCVIMGLFARKKKKNLFGIIFGIISGMIGGLSVIFQFSAMNFIPTDDLFANFDVLILMFPANLFFICFMIGGALEFLITQYAFTNGKAVEVVPANQSFFILIPIVGGIFIFAESFNLIQLIGTILIIFGIIFCTAFKKLNDDEKSS